MLTGDESPKESTSALRLWLNCDRIPIAARSQCIVVIDEHTVLAGTDMIGESRADQCFGPSQNLEEDSAAVTIQLRYPVSLNPAKVDPVNLQRLPRGSGVWSDTLDNNAAEHHYLLGIPNQS